MACWGQSNFSRTRIGDPNRYLIMSEVSDLLISELTPEKYNPHGRFHVLEPTGEFWPQCGLVASGYEQDCLRAEREEIVADDLAR